MSGVSSYSRYVSGNEFFGQPGVGAFAGSGSVDSVSALSFTNTSFWGGTEGNEIALNTLRTINFTVNNYEAISDTENKTSEVLMDYSLVFTAPQNFSERLAIQLFDGENVAILPQIVISELILADGGTYNTALSKDYTGETFTYTDADGNTVNDLEFNITSEDGIYTAVSQKDGTVITITPFEEEIEQTLHFRLWDVRTLTDPDLYLNADTEGGTLLPPLTMKYTEVVPCYKIAIKKADFLFSAAAPESKSYILSLAPTATLHDDHLGGYAVDDEHNPVVSVASDQEIGLEITTLAVTDTIDGVVGETKESTLLGGIPSYYEGQVKVTEHTSHAYTENISLENVNSSSQNTSFTVNGVTYSTQTLYYNANGQSVTREQNGRYRIIITYTQTIEDIDRYSITKKWSTTETETATVDSVVITNQDNIITETVHQSIEIVTTEDASFTGAKTNYTKTSYGLSIAYATRNTRNQAWDTTATEEDMHQNITANATPLPNDTFVANGDSVEVDKTELANLSSEYEDYTDKIINTQEFERQSVYVTQGGAMITPTEISRRESANSEDYIYYTPDNPFEFYAYETNSSGEQALVQQYFLSQCYSKNYPMTVNILFSQIDD